MFGKFNAEIDPDVTKTVKNKQLSTHMKHYFRNITS